VTGISKIPMSRTQLFENEAAYDLHPPRSRCSMTPMTSLQLLAEIRAGRNVKAAQEELYVQVRAALLARLEAKIPPVLRSRIDAEDILHDAFIRAIAALDQFQAGDDRSFLAWVNASRRTASRDSGSRRSAYIPHFLSDTDRPRPRASPGDVPRHDADRGDPHPRVVRSGSSTGSSRASATSSASATSRVGLRGDRRVLGHDAGPPVRQ